MPFFDFTQFCFQINYSSIMIVQKNRPFGDKNETNQKTRCIMNTWSSRRIFYCLRVVCFNGIQQKRLEGHMKEKCRGVRSTIRNATIATGDRAV